MARQNYLRVMDEIYDHEGGYADHPRDPGGATKYGITHITLADYRGQPVTKEDVRNLTRLEANKIYRSRYWEVVQGDALPYGFDLVAMDGAVNSGPKRGVRWLQIGVGAKADGAVGPATIEAARAAPVEGISRACAARMSFLRALSHWDAFGRGWSRRVASVEAVGVRMWVEAAKGKSAAQITLRSMREAVPGRIEAAKRAGQQQVGATGAGGAGGAVGVSGTPEAAIAIALVVVVAAVFLIVRTRRRMQHEADRAEALGLQIEGATA
jgi:lysozyme family protein